MNARAEQVTDAHSGGWMPLEQWQALVRGDACVLCKDLRANVMANDFIHTVADLGASRLWLATNQIVPGYCVVVARQHVCEPFDLPASDQTAFFADVTRAARAVQQVFQPLKLNLHLMGNAVPHLHCHVIPRYYGDPAPGKPLFPEDLGTLRLDQAVYAERVSALRGALA